MKKILLRLFAAVLRSYGGRDTLEAVGQDLFRQPRLDPRHPPFPLSPPPDHEPNTAVQTDQKGPVFITSRFRSGSTFLWSLFEQTAGITAYYEPLNERRWFLPSHRKDVDPTHRGVESYCRAYEGMEDLAPLFSDHWGNACLYMDPASGDPLLETYIGALISRASGRPILQFNRVDFRLAWLKSRFPSARIVHLHRNPRDQWVSILGPGSGCTPRTRLDEFSNYDRFYLLTWAKDLARVFPFIELSGNETPYALHYLIWRLSHSCGLAFADLSISYESLIADPGSVNAALRESIDLSFDRERFADLCSPPERGRWRDFAAADWYESVEARCERLLEGVYSCGSIRGQ